MHDRSQEPAYLHVGQYRVSHVSTGQPLGGQLAAQNASPARFVLKQSVSLDRVVVVVWLTVVAVVVVFVAVEVSDEVVLEVVIVVETEVVLDSDAVVVSVVSVAQMPHDVSQRCAPLQVGQKTVSQSAII